MRDCAFCLTGEKRMSSRAKFDPSVEHSRRTKRLTGYAASYAEMRKNPYSSRTRFPSTSSERRERDQGNSFDLAKESFSEGGHEGGVSGIGVVRRVERSRVKQLRLVESTGLAAGEPPDQIVKRIALSFSLTLSLLLPQSLSLRIRDPCALAASSSTFHRRVLSCATKQKGPLT